MTQTEHIEYWLDSAVEDLETARIIFDTKRFVWCLFIGHLALEKLIKALFVQNTGEITPPKIHNLIKLSNAASINLTDELKEFFADLNRFHIESRYPEYKNDLKNVATESFTIEHLKKIEEVFKWLKSQMK